MAADPNIGYSYRPGFSSIGVIFTNPPDGPCIISRVPFTHFRRPQQCNVNDTYICSSSDGLVALYDEKTHIYYIGNPLTPGQESYRTPLEDTPGTHHPPEYTDVVLVTDFSIPDRPAYHLICAFKDEDHDGLYTFDTYSSLRGSWRSYTDIHLPGGGMIRPGTGVSCNRFVYWLTMEPCLVVCFDIDNIRHQPAASWLPPVGDNVLALPETMSQLGRIQNRVGLVVVDASDSDQSATLYLLKADGWDPYAKLNLSVDDSWLFGLVPVDGRLMCNSLPRPLRFQSSKLEVFFLYSGRHVVLWEMDGNDRERKRVITLPGIVPFPSSFLAGTSHVGTSLLPEIFRLMPPDRGISQARNDGHESAASCSTSPSSESF